MSSYDRNWTTRPMLDPAFQQLLARNGITAEIQLHGDNYVLAVRGHDAPQTIKYELTGRQVDELTLRWLGSNSNQQAAYKAFVSIVENDYDCPIDFTHAKHANSTVALGNHGYAVSGEMRMYGNYSPSIAGSFNSPYLGFGIRQQQGYHLRFHSPHNAYVPVRPDGRVKPGEAYAGGYGFYYNPKTKLDVLQGAERGNSTLRAEQGGGVVTADTPKLVMPVPYDSGRAAIPMTSKMEYPSNLSVPTISKENLLAVYNSHGIYPIPEKNELFLRSPAGWTKYNVDSADMEIIMNPFDKDRFGEHAEILDKYISQDFEGKVLWDVFFDEKSGRYAPRIGEATGTWSRLGLESEAAFDAELKAGREQSIICAPNIFPEELKPAQRLAHDSPQVAEIATQTIPGEIKSIVISKDGTLTWNKDGVEDSFELPAELAEAAARGELSSTQAYNFIKFLRENPETANVLRVANSPLSERVENIVFGTDSIAITVDGRTTAIPLNSNAPVFQLGLSESQLKAAIGNIYVLSIEHPELTGGRIVQQPEDSGLSTLRPEMAWYAEVKNGRRLSVTDISFPKEPINGKYYMTAVVNGVGMTYEISEKDSIKASRLDELHKLMLFDKLCPDVKMRKISDFDTLYYDEDIQKVCGTPDLTALAPDKAWYYDLEGGRQANVGVISATHQQYAIVKAGNQEIRIPVPESGMSKEAILSAAASEFAKQGIHIRPETLASAKIDTKDEYWLSAQIDGKTEKRDLTDEEYERFAQLSDKGRLDFTANKFSGLICIKEVEQAKQEAIDGRGRDYIDGASLTNAKPEKGWYSGKGLSREAHSVGMITVSDNAGRYVMQAVIDGQLVQKDISKKDYDKFLASDANGKIKLFDKKFDEVKCEDHVPTPLGMKILGGFMAACEVASYGMAVAADVSQDLRILKGQAPVPTMSGTVSVTTVSSVHTGITVAQANYDYIAAASNLGPGLGMGY